MARGHDITHLPCKFCDYPKGDWKKCPRCDAPRRNVGKWLAEKWNVDVKQALFHRDGSFWDKLTKFPGALFDPAGYVIFHKEEEFTNSNNLIIKNKTNTKRGLRLPEFAEYNIGNPPLKRFFPENDEEEIKDGSGFIYALTNPAWPKWVKIGRTIQDDVNNRLDDYQTYSPLQDYEPIGHVDVSDAVSAEQKAHAIARVLSGEDAWNSREWFRLSHEHAKLILSSVES